MKKPYTAEAQVRGTDIQYGAYGPSASVGTDGAVFGEELFELLSDIRQEVRDLRASIGTGAALPGAVLRRRRVRPDGPVFPQCDGGRRRGPGRSDRDCAHGQLAGAGQASRLRQSVTPTRTTRDCVDEAASELDAIVKATENATSTILDSSESIGHAADRIRQLAGYDEELSEIADKIADQAMTILEACNFQDLTGQRITKVVQTLEFIADRIKAIIAAWGLDAFKGVPLPEKLQVHSEDELVEGPQLDGGGISQDEIDALFD